MTAATMTDREALAMMLVQSASGDQKAFAEVYRRTSAKLFGVCLRMLHHRDEAEEVLQEVYVTVWQRASSFDPGRASPITWLVTMARNKSIDRLRKHREETTSEPIEIESDEPTPVADAQSRQDRQRLENCMDKLDSQHKSAVREAFFSGATYIELAERCKVPLGTMKSWIRRSLMRLRTCLEQ